MFNTKSKPSHHRQRPTRKSRRCSRALRQNRKRLFLETLETRIVLSSVPQLIDLNPYGASAPSEFVQVGDVAYFAADDGISGRELWRTDGTAAGTAMVKDLHTGTAWDWDAYSYVPNSSSPQQLTNVIVHVHARCRIPR